MSHKIKKVEYLDGYKLKLHFEDKSVKIVDLEAMLKKAKNMLIPLIDLDYFKQVKIDGITICWPNGVDFCPDVLYRMGKSVISPKNLKRTILRSSINKSRKQQKA